MKRANNHIDLKGKRFGRWTVLKLGKSKIYNTAHGPRPYLRWWCICDCGEKREVSGNSLQTGNSKSCGCINKEKGPWNFKDLAGKKFGELTVISLAGNYKKNKWNEVKWHCSCSCGRKSIVRTGSLSSGNSQSCGQCVRMGQNNWRYVERIKATCFACGEKIDRLPRIAKLNNNQFCNQECVSIFMRNRPPEEHPKWKGGNRPAIGRIELLDHYVKALLRQSGVKNENITPEMIELKRELLIFHRLAKEVKDGIDSARD